MITNEGIIIYPKLFVAELNLSEALKYSCSFLAPKQDQKGIEKLKAEVARATQKGKEQKWSNKIPKFNYAPLRDGDEELKDGTKEGAEYKGCFFINPSCGEDQQPGVVGPDAEPLMNQNLIYSGCIVRLDVRAYPYKTGGNNGIAWWLNNVMLVKDGERLDGKQNAEDAFADYKVAGEEEDLA